MIFSSGRIQYDLLTEIPEVIFIVNFSKFMFLVHAISSNLRIYVLVLVQTCLISRWIDDYASNNILSVLCFKKETKQMKDREIKAITNCENTTFEMKECSNLMYK